MGPGILRIALLFALLGGGCDEPAPVDEPTAPGPDVEVRVEVPREPTMPDPEPDAPHDPLAGLTEDGAASFGAPGRLDDRTGARVRNAIRARIGTRPTLITSRHYTREDGGTVTVTTFTGEYVERCVTAGTPREECLLAQGEGALATEVTECVFGGLARVDIGPMRGELEGDVRTIGVETIGLGEICSFEVESLAVRDEDRDGEPEIILGYGWSDLRHLGAERVPLDEGSVRWILRPDLGEQARLEMRHFHHAHGEASADERNRVTQLRFVPRAGRRDIALDAIDWLAAACPEADPPRGHGEVCQMRERTVTHRYSMDEDRWDEVAEE